MSHQIMKSFAALALGLAVLSPAAAFANGNEGRDNSPNGVAIAVNADGNVTVRRATVTAVASSTVTATTVFGGTTLTWTINTDSSTKFLGKGEGSIALANIAVGDGVSFTGQFNTGSTLSVRASVVRNPTKTLNGTTLVGTIASTNASTTALSVTRGGGATTTVTLASGANILVNGIASAFSALQTGDLVKALGSWNAEQTVFTATTLAVGRAPSGDGKGFKNFFKKMFSGHGSRHDD